MNNGRINRGSKVTTPPCLNRKLNLKGMGEYYELTNIAKVEKFPYQGIWIFSGGQGTGKTLNLIHTLLDIKSRYPKCIIVSNIPLYGIDYYIYNGIEDFEKYNNGINGIVYVLDEIQTLYDSLQSKNMHDIKLDVWSQNRKNCRVILGTSQRFTRVAKPIREQTCFHIECLRKMFCFHRYKIYDGYMYDNDGNYTGEKPRIQWYIPKIKPMLSYDTHFVVQREDK